MALILMRGPLLSRLVDTWKKPLVLLWHMEGMQSMMGIPVILALAALLLLRVPRETFQLIHAILLILRMLPRNTFSLLYALTLQEIFPMLYNNLGAPWVPQRMSLCLFPT